MKHITVLTWIGLALIGLVYFFLMPVLLQEIGMDFSYSAYEAFDRYVWVYMTVSLAACVLAIVLLSLKSMLALVLAMIGSIAFVPISLIFLMGFQVSRHNTKFKNFKMQDEMTGMFESFAFNKPSSLLLQGLLLFGMGLVLYLVVGGMGGMIMAVGILYLFIYNFQKKRELGWLTEHELVLHAQMFAKAVVIPLKDIVDIDGYKLTVKDPVSGELIKVKVLVNFLRKEDKPRIIPCITEARNRLLASA